MRTRAVIAVLLCLGLAACFGGGGDDTATEATGEDGAGALPTEDGSGVEDGDQAAELAPVTQGAGAGGEDGAGGSDAATGEDAAGTGGETAGSGEAGGGGDGSDADAGGGTGGADAGVGDAGAQDAGGGKPDAGGGKPDAGGGKADAGAPDDAACSEKDTCTHCVHETAPESEADCSCPLCPVYPMPSSRCTANAKAFDDVCSAWLAKVICPVPLCVLPPELSCVDGTCSALAPAM